MGNTGWTNLLGHSTQLLDVATSFTALPALAPAMPLARIAELQQLLQLWMCDVHGHKTVGALPVSPQALCGSTLITVTPSSTLLPL